MPTTAVDLNEAATFSYHPVNQYSEYPLSPRLALAQKGSLGGLKVMCLWEPHFNRAVFRLSLPMWPSDLVVPNSESLSLPGQLAEPPKDSLER